MPELLLERNNDRLTVTLGETTGTLAWSDVAPHEQTAEQLFTDARAYGQMLFTRLFCTDELCAAVRNLPSGERLVLVAEDPVVASIPWEYLRDPVNDSLLAGRLNMVRSLSREQRRAPSPVQEPLHLLALPVSPLNDDHPLNTEQEWKHLLTAVTTPISGTPKNLNVLRVRPPTLSGIERSLPGQGSVIVHFMGHSGHTEKASVLVFEDALGWSASVTAEQLAEALDAHVQLVLLNSCLSATIASTDRATEFGNLARSLVRRGIPYALGMQFVLPDEAALALSQAFYDFLLQGRGIEEAVRRTRRALNAQTGLPQPHWLAGLPVLYTCLREPAPPMHLSIGQPQIHPDPRELEQNVDLTALPEAAQVIGRSEALRTILKTLLAPAAHGFVLIHGMGGIGKTTLARAAATRASWYYGDRVLALSFETFATFDATDQMTVNETFAATFLNRLARFYSLDPSDPVYQSATALQEAILRRRSHTRSLLVLDNLETLLEAHQRGHAGASALAAFLRRLREGDGAVLLTSRNEPPADWEVNERIHVQGISTEAGAVLFLSLLPADRRSAAPQQARQALSERVQGHPLGIRLLAGQFAQEFNDLATFLSHIEEELAVAEQQTPTSLYDAGRQKTIYACLHYSVKHLTETQQQVLHACSLFQSQFLPTFAAALFDDDEKEQILLTLQKLQHLGLLEQSLRTFPEGTITQLELHALTRWYLQHDLPELPARWCERYGHVYEQLARQAFQPEGGYDQNAVIRFLMRQSLSDCEVILRQHYLPPQTEGALAYHLAKPYERLGQVQRALALREHALEGYQELGSLREIAVTQHAIADLLVQQGKVSEALALYEQSLHTMQDLGDLRGIAVTQHAIANLLVQQGKVSEALALYEQSLHTEQDLGDLRGIAVTQHAIADLLVQQGKVSEALALYEQSLHTEQDLGDLRGIAVTQHAIADLLVQQGKVSEALALYEQSLHTKQDLGDRREIAVTQHAIANLLVQQGKVSEALALYEQSLHTDQDLGDLRGIAVTQHAIADLLVQQGKVSEALALYEQSLHTEQDLGDLRGIAVTQHAIADLLVQQGKVSEALALYEQSLHTKQDLGDRREIAVTQHAIANLLVQQGKVSEALALYEQSLHTEQDLGDLRSIAVTQHAIADLLVQQGKVSEALALYEQSLHTEQDLGDLRGIAVTQHAIADLLVQQGKVSEALALYEQSLHTKQDLGDRREIAVTQHAIANLLVQQGKVSEALALYEQSLHTDQDLGDLRGIAVTQHAIADLLVQQGKVSEALALYEQSLHTEQDLGDLRGIAVTQHAIADLLVQQGKVSEALALYEQSLHTKQDLGDRREIAVTQHAIANLLVQQGKVSEALALYEQSLHTMQDLGDRREIAVTQHAIANLLVQQGKVSEALALYEQSLHTEQDLGDLRGIAVTQATLSQLWFLKGDYPQALSLAWDAYSTLHLHGFLPDVQQIQTILMAMKAEDVQRFDALWEETLKEPQPTWLSEIQSAPSHREGGISSEQLRVFVANTIAVMTAVPEKRSEWRETIVDVLQQVQAMQREQDSAFFAALLALLDGQPSSLPDDHPYADALAIIKEQIVSYDPQKEDETPSVSAEMMQAIRDFVNAEDWEETRHVLEERRHLLFQPEVEAIFLQNIAQAQQQEQQRAVELLLLHLGLLQACKEQGIAQAFEQFLALRSLPFDPELIPRSIAALKKGSAPQERMVYAQYLATLLAQSEDAGTKQLVTTLQLALFGGDFAQLGTRLHGIYQQVWEMIVQQVTAEEKPGEPPAP